jgi:hypothetical protein
MMTGLLCVVGGGRKAAAHGKRKDNGNQGLAVIEKQKGGAMGLSTLRFRGPKNIHELNPPRESLLLCATCKLYQFSAERPVVQRKGDKRAVLPAS